jgi:hypothetical protein
VSVPTITPLTTKSTEEIAESVDGNVTVSVPTIEETGSDELTLPSCMLESAVAQEMLLGSDSLFILTTAAML